MLEHDDGLVLHDGKLWKPEDLSRAAAQNFERFDGLTSRSLIKRYARCYPHPDATTPTFQEFKKDAQRKAPA